MTNWKDVHDHFTSPYNQVVLLLHIIFSQLFHLVIILLSKEKWRFAWMNKGTNVFKLTFFHFNFRNLQQNRLICDCNLKWMLKWGKRSKRPSVRGRCQYPFAVRDKKIEQVDRNDMICGKEECYYYYTLSFAHPRSLFKMDSSHFRLPFSMGTDVTKRRILSQMLYQDQVENLSFWIEV